MDYKGINSFCDEKRFSTFFRENSKSLSNYIFYKCGNLDLANDIVQDAFLKFWSNCSKVIPGKGKAFLYRIATNLFLNEYSKSTVVLNFKSTLSDTITNESPEFLLEEKEFGIKLQRAISNLTESQRVTFLMHRIDGKKYREIAEILNISIKTVEKRIHYALINLRKEIENI